MGPFIIFVGAAVEDVFMVLVALVQIIELLWVFSS